MGFLPVKKNIPYDSSKLTKLLRATVAQNTSVCLLACLNPNEANFEDSMNTLTHLERCKYFELGAKSSAQDKENAGIIESQKSRIQPKAQEN